MSKFKVGDRVVAITAADGNQKTKGVCGTVMAVHPHFSVGVEFDKDVEGHLLGHENEDGVFVEPADPPYGWWCQDFELMNLSQLQENT